MGVVILTAGVCVQMLLWSLSSRQGQVLAQSWHKVVGKQGGGWQCISMQKQLAIPDCDDQIPAVACFVDPSKVFGPWMQGEGPRQTALFPEHGRDYCL
jgi:hypothetical protein